MKALTICQPYPELILRGLKLVENRTRPVSYRGHLLIHAGKSREWLNVDPADGMDASGIPLREMTFGAIVGRCKLHDCVLATDIWAGKRYSGLINHIHVNGPWCWVLRDVHRFERPIPYRGALGLFDVPDEVLSDAKVAA